MNDKGRRALLMGGAAASLQLWWLRVLTKKFHFYGNITQHEAKAGRRSDLQRKHVGTNVQQKQLADSICLKQGHYDLGSSSSDESSTRESSRSGGFYDRYLTIGIQIVVSSLRPIVTNHNDLNQPTI